MRSALFLLLAPALLAVLGAGCTVDDGVLDTALFECTSDDQCGDAWGCVRATPYAVDFCAPRCTDETCDGICTSDSLCLHGCQIYPDGTTSACPSDDYACIRTSIESASGVCYPVAVCALDSDCAAGEACLSVGFEVSQLYCVPSAVPTPCAAGSVNAADLLEGIAPYCLPTCGADRACPPAFGCLEQLTFFSDMMPPPPPPCVPGIPGVSCEDDSNCLFGRCLDGDGASAQDKICTITCDEASRQFGAAGCGGLASGGFEGLFSMECDAAAGGGADGGLCSLRYAIGWPNCTGPTGAYPCASDPPGTMCLPFDIGTEHYDVCTRVCTSSTQCNAPGTIRNYCAMGAGGSGICIPRAALGGACAVDEGCRAGRCVGATATTDGVCTL